MPDMTSDRPLVVVNPSASQMADPARRRRIVASVTEAVEARTGRSPVVVDTTPAAARRALAAARSSPLVVVVGGDGTIRDAAEPLLGSGVPIAIVPAGTGNVFASVLGIPRRLSLAVKLIGSGKPEAIDVGAATWGSNGEDGVPDDRTTHQRTFVVACGLGLDARVMAATSTDLKRRLGFSAYIVSTAREAARVRPVDFRIDADGDVHEVNGLVVMLANCGQIIPGLVGPRRPIDPTDGLLDVIVIRASGAVGGLIALAEVLLERDDPPHHRSRSMRIRARQVRVTAVPTEPFQVDGDHHRADWVTAETRPGALTVLRA
jgi:diacylglycerol kinase (ATP)